MNPCPVPQSITTGRCPRGRAFVLISVFLSCVLASAWTVGRDGDEPGSILLARISAVSNRTEITIVYPHDFTNRLDIFRCSDLTGGEMVSGCDNQCEPLDESNRMGSYECGRDSRFVQVLCGGEC